MAGKRFNAYRDKLYIARVAKNHTQMAADIEKTEAELAAMANSKTRDSNLKMIQDAIVFMKTNLAAGQARHAEYVEKWVKPPKPRKFK